MKTVLLSALALCALASTDLVLAATPESVRFNLRDWELVCDNTRTCRAAGYQAEDGEQPPVSVLLERKAGPAQAILARLRLGEAEDGAQAPVSVTMLVDDRPLGTISLDRKESTGRLSRAQSEALVRALVGTGKAEWRAGRRTWVLSGAGAAAVLLKMDEFQGRLGTQGAAARKGTKPETDVRPPLPPLAIMAAAVPRGVLPRLGKAEERLLLAALRKTVGKDDCDQLETIASGENEFSYAPLTNEKMLVSALCWRAAYNEGSGYWVANRRPPFAPRFVTNLGTSYENGTIVAVQKGRGIADCLSQEEWVWDGKRFIHASDGTTGMCRGIAGGGTWELPTLVSRIER